MSAGSKTNPGGYSMQEDSLEQFQISDDRTPEEICQLLKRMDYDPIWKDWDLSYDLFDKRQNKKVFHILEFKEILYIPIA